VEVEVFLSLVVLPTGEDAPMPIMAMMKIMPKQQKTFLRVSNLTFLNKLGFINPITKQTNAINRINVNKIDILLFINFLILGVFRTSIRRNKNNYPINSGTDRLSFSTGGLTSYGSGWRALPQGKERAATCMP
jgi:hypothetical protein